MSEVLQSIARRVVLKAYLDTDHVSAATGKTIAVTISKNGGAFGNPSAGATNATEIASGWYYVDLSTTDTATLGPIIVRGTNADIDDTEWTDMVVKATNGGRTGIPDAAADAAGGLPISDAGGLDLDAKLAATNEVTAARMGALTDWINGGRLDLILDIIAADTTTDIPATLATILTEVDTNLPSDVEAVKLDTEDIKSRLPAALTADGNIKADTLRIGGTLQTAGDVGAKTGFALTSAYDFAKGTVAMTEAYAAKNAAPTPAEALFMAIALLTERAISGTTMTVKKIDQSTTAMTLTLDDGNTPTSQTRAS